MPKAVVRRGSPPDPDALITSPEACTLLRVGRSWLALEVRKGAQSSVPFLRVGRYIRFRRSDLLEWMRRQSQGGAA